MKRLVSVLLVACFLMSLSVIALADVNIGNIDLEYLASSAANITTQGNFGIYSGKTVSDYGSVGFFAGASLGSGGVRVLFDYGDFDLKPTAGGNEVLDTKLTDIGAGFRLIGSKTARVDLTASYLTLEMQNSQDANYNTEISGLMAGGEMLMAVTPKFLVEIGAQGSLDVKPSILFYDNTMGQSTSKTASVVSYRVKGICMVDPNIGITLGYHGILPQIKYDYGNNVSVELHSSLESVILGVEARF